MAKRRNSFMVRTALSWRLIRASAAHLRANTDLLIYPIVSAFLTIVVLLVFALSVLALKGFDVWAVRNTSTGARLLVMFLFYLVVYCVTYFTNTALVGAALRMMDGERPTMRESIAIAWERRDVIFGYALIMATVGMVFRWLYGRGGLPSRLAGPILRRVVVFSFLGLAWHLVTFFVVPILVVENVGPIEAVKRSSRLVKETWGEQIVGNTSIWLIFSAPVIIFVLLVTPLLSRAVDHANIGYTIVALYAVVMVIVTFLLIQMALQAIFSAALYRYAVGLPVADQFDETVLRNAFRPRPSRIATRVRSVVHHNDTTGPSHDA
jgi:hypothetical protein